MDSSQMVSVILFICFFAYLVILVGRIKENEKFRALMDLWNLTKRELDSYFHSYDQLFIGKDMICTLQDFKNGVPPKQFSADNKALSPAEYTADCYSILNKLCALGNVKKMYIPKCIDEKKSFIENQLLMEKEVAANLKVSKNKSILDVGCGCGRVAHHISSVTDCTVYGINIDVTQIKDAQKYAKDQQYEKTKFILQDLNEKMPFSNEMFDGIYDLGGFTSFITDYDAVFNEMFRILKPGSRFVVCDAVLLDAFDGHNKKHLDLMNKARPVLAGGVLLHYKYFEAMAKKAGFEIIKSDGGEGESPPELPMLLREHHHFDTVEKIISFLTFARILPKHMKDLVKFMRNGAEELIEMEKQNLITSEWEFIFQKPAH